jgi:putative transposase
MNALLPASDDHLRLNEYRLYGYATLMLKTFQYRLYPNKQQQRLLDHQLEECRWLYNHLLAERKTAWDERQASLRRFDQQATLPLVKTERPSLASVHSQVLQHVVLRIDLAFQAFFRRVKAGETPGYPRFRGKGRYSSLTFPQVPIGCKLDVDEKRLRIANVGLVKVLLHRPLEGTPKTATICRSSTGKWHVCFSCECAEPAPLPAAGQPIGIDVGLKTFATLSSGEEIANPRFFRHEEHALAKALRRLRRAELGTPERAKRRHVVARVHERVAWRRSNFAHQHSRSIIDRFDLIAVEDLAVKRLTQNHCLAKSIHDAAWSQFASLLAKSIHDAAWSQFASLLAYKAAWAGRRYVAVNPAYTSQDCSRCGQRHKLTLVDRTYHCPQCGLVLDRDLNASLNILSVGQHALASA